MVRTEFALAALAIALCGCMSDGIRGRRAEEAQDYVAARAAYEKVLNASLNTRHSRRNPDFEQQSMMLAYYDLGRTTGYTCNYVEAERLLREALNYSEHLEPRYSHRTAILSELGRLTFDAGKFKESVNFYEEAISRLDSFSFVGRDPIGFATFLEDYAMALEKAGESDKAAETRARAGSIRASHPNDAALFTPIYYRNACRGTKKR